MDAPLSDGRQAPPETPAVDPARPGVLARRRLLRRGVLLLGALAALLMLDRLADLAATRWTFNQLHAEGGAAAALRITVIRSEIEKQRTLPLVLGADPDVRAALEARDPARLRALDSKFATLAAGARTGVIYLLDPRGITVAASNAGTAESFVDSDYSFRPYFRQALAEGQAEHFALGTVSHKPGLYLTRRIDGDAGPLGVLVVKAEFDAVEADWKRLNEPTFVTDPRAVVLVTSVPDWRFRAAAPLADARRAAIAASRAFGDAALAPLPLTPLPVPQDGAADALPVGAAAIPEVVEGAVPGGRRQPFVMAAAPIPDTDWTLHVLAPAGDPLRVASAVARSLAWLGGLLGLGTVGLLLIRRRDRVRERQREAARRRELEARVADRTAALSESNERLRAEMDERRRTQDALDGLKDELVQAGRLAVLGQIAASVAHEVNQPVAAIRTFAESGTLLLDRGDAGAARANLSTIAGLTDRIGAITRGLKAFARKTPGTAGPVPLGAAIDGALLLVGYRLTQQAVALEVELADPDLAVQAELVRLEQVFVNLLQNALEALGEREGGAIRIAAAAHPDRPQTVEVTVADNGPGLPQAVMDALFIPFTTTKPQGLGLGLVIAHDIVVEFGGTLAARNQGGAVFILTLPRARPEAS